MNHEIHERLEKLIFIEKSYAIQDAIFELRKVDSCLINEINKSKSNRTILLNNIFVPFAIISIYM